MSTEANTSLIRRYFAEVLNEHDPTRVDTVFTPDHRYHLPLPPAQLQSLQGAAGMRHHLAQVFAGFADVRFGIEDVVAADDNVVVRWTSAGTHTGASQGLAPTGKRVVGSGIAIMRIAGGRVAETWEEVDMLGFLRQLGALPAPAQAPT